MNSDVGAECSPVLVIGSGLGGLAAATVAAARGYPVILFEKNDWIGGKAAVLQSSLTASDDILNRAAQIGDDDSIVPAVADKQAVARGIGQHTIGESQRRTRPSLHRQRNRCPV